MKTSRILFAALLVLLSGVVYGQDIDVTGNVLDASDGTAVPYASVHVKGTMRGVSADDQGRFSISAPGDGVLVFTCIGYDEKEVAVQGRSVVHLCFVKAFLRIFCKIPSLRGTVLFCLFRRYAFLQARADLFTVPKILDAY